MPSAAILQALGLGGTPIQNAITQQQTANAPATPAAATPTPAPNINTGSPIVQQPGMPSWLPTTAINNTPSPAPVVRPPTQNTTTSVQRQADGSYKTFNLVRDNNTGTFSANEQGADGTLTPVSFAQAGFQDPATSYSSFGSGSYGGYSGLSGAGTGFMQDIINRINGLNSKADINNAFDLQTQHAMRELGLQNEIANAGKGYRAGDPMARSLGARLTGQLLSPIMAARAQALVGADRDQIQMLSGLLPSMMESQRWGMQQQQAERQRALDEQDRQRALQEHQADLDYQRQVRDLQLQQMRKQATASQRLQVPEAPSLSYAGSYAPSSSPNVSSAAYRLASGGGGGYAPPINAPGTDGYNFWNGFGQSFYGPLGRGGAENALDAATRRAEIAASGNGYGNNSAQARLAPGAAPVAGMSSAMSDLLQQAQGAMAPPLHTSRQDIGNHLYTFSGAGSGPPTFTPGGATAAPIAGGAQLAYAPPMSGIGFGGPLTTDPILQNSPYGNWETGPTAYAIATGRA